MSVYLNVYYYEYAPRCLLKSWADFIHSHYLTVHPSQVITRKRGALQIVLKTPDDFLGNKTDGFD
jgi:hypothetical protein